MKALNFAFVFLSMAFVGAAEYEATEILMNILNQFLSSQSTVRETSPPSSDILPKILNPLHWIPNFENIPYNPDSELTTVSDLKKVHTSEFSAVFGFTSC